MINNVLAALHAAKKPKRKTITPEQQAKMKQQFTLDLQYLDHVVKTGITSSSDREAESAFALSNGIEHIATWSPSFILYEGVWFIGIRYGRRFFVFDKSAGTDVMDLLEFGEPVPASKMHGFGVDTKSADDARQFYADLLKACDDPQSRLCSDWFRIISSVKRTV